MLRVRIFRLCIGVEEDYLKRMRNILIYREILKKEWGFKNVPEVIFRLCFGGREDYLKSVRNILVWREILKKEWGMKNVSKVIF